MIPRSGRGDSHFVLGWKDKNIEKFIKKGVYETYLIGDYMYDIKLPKVKGNVVFRDKGGFFSRLFS